METEEQYGALVRQQGPPPMTVNEMKAQVNHIQEVMKAVMQENQHYGIIPGTEKPTLMKPGAEKLSFTFHLVPKYEITSINHPGGHREYQIICSLIYAPTGHFAGQGVGSCSTLEAKYKYRNAEPELTNTPVPKKYWDLKKAGKIAEAQALLGGKGLVAKKTDSGWFIAKKTGERVEHDNPADYYNTVLKMGKKRAHVDAILTATAASDIFTQDLDDDIGNEPATSSPPAKEQPHMITEPQRKKLFAMLKEADETVDSFKLYLETEYNITSTKNIPADKFDSICQKIKTIGENKAKESEETDDSSEES